MTKSPEIVQIAHQANAKKLQLQIFGDMPDFAGAACTTLPAKDADLFFSGKRSDIAAAKAICASCPLIETCFVYAVSEPDLHGIWAGTTKTQRAKLRRNSAAPLTADQYDEGRLILTATVSTLAARYNVNVRTIARWKNTLKNQHVFRTDVDLAA